MRASRENLGPRPAMDPCLPYGAVCPGRHSSRLLSQARCLSPPAHAAELAVAMREHLAAASAAAAALDGGAAAAPDGEARPGSGTLSPLGAPRTPLASAPSAQLTAQHRRKLEEQLEAAAQAEQDGSFGAISRSGSAAAAAAAGKEVARARLGERHREQAQALLLRWVEEQEGGAFEALEKAKTSLLSHKARRCWLWPGLAALAAAVQ